MRLNIKTLSIIYFSWNLICIIFLSFYNETFWYDEAYSIGLVKMSFKEIWDMTAFDVHPPLYYFILKVFASIFGDSLPSLHLCSLLGLLGIYFLGIFPIRRLWGIKTTYAFTLFISILPVTLYLGLEIRMYSWLAFFVLATAIYGYEAYLKSSYSSYIKLSIFAILASYTHNYGLVSALIIYFMLWVMFILNKKKILPLVVSSLISLAIFAFWIPCLYYQVTAVKESYWIQIFTIDQFFDYATTFFYTLSYGPITTTISSIFYITIYIGIFTYIFKVNKKNIDRKRLAAALFFIGVFFLVLFSTATVSLIFKPILVRRYLVSVLGCICLGFAIFVASVDNSSKFIKSCGLIIVISLASLYTLRLALTYSHNKEMNQQQNNLIQYFDKNINPVDEDFAVIGSGFNKFIISTLSIIEPEKKYRYFFTKDDLVSSVSWAPYPFDITIINSLKDEPDLIFVVEDISINFLESRVNYIQSIETLEKEIKDNYTIVKVDTVDINEIRTLRRNIKNITNLDEQKE